MITKIKFWQWPNILAIDAAIISVAWLWVFAHEQSVALTFSAYAVLALSVWLTYISDRLFDASQRPASQLLSTRHQFAKRHKRILWCIWISLLLLTLVVAITSLNQLQLKRGFLLLFLCLAYTGANQLLSKNFFPKELIVALIFAGGTQVFLPEVTQWQSLTGFTLLCLVNCLSIAWKERPIDALLQVRSLSSTLEFGWGYLLLSLAACLSLFSSCIIALLHSILALALLHLLHKRFTQESYRVLCDASLLLGPFLYFLFSGVFVR